jgi:uncharacterized protein (TIGR03435 family)
LKATLISGPDWTATERFDISATLPDGASREPKVSFHVGEQHLHFSLQTALVLEGISAAKRQSFLSRGFIERH